MSGGFIDDLASARYPSRRQGPSAAMRGASLALWLGAFASPALTGARAEAVVDPVPACDVLGSAAADIDRCASQARPPNSAESIDLHRKAAEAGSAEAMHSLADAYERGDGVEADLGVALDWYRKAAALGHPRATNAVGVAYSNGLGVEPDDAEAGRWFLRAAELGEPWGMKNAGDWFSEGRMGGPPDLARGVEWTRKAADLGLAEAQTRLGYFHLVGMGMAKNESEALRLFGLGAEGGDPVGMNNLGHMLQLGLASSSDPERGFQWLLRAAEAGNVDGMENVAAAYREGRGVRRDDAAAAAWLARAAEARAN